MARDRSKFAQQSVAIEEISTGSTRFLGFILLLIKLYENIHQIFKLVFHFTIGTSLVNFLYSIGTALNSESAYINVGRFLQII